MQSGVGGRNPAGTPTTTGRSQSTSSASPASSSSTSIHQQQQQQKQQHQQQLQQQLQQQQQQQQFAFRQSFQQHQLRKPEEGLASYPGGAHGVASRSNFQFSPSDFQRKFNDSQQPYGGPQNQEDNQIKVQGLNQHAQNQVYPNYAQIAAFQAQQKSFGNMQSHQQARMVNVSLPGRDQELRMGNVKMQELMSLQAANQAQSLMSKKPEQVPPVDRSSGFVPADQKSDPKPPQAVSGLTSPANISRHPQLPQPGPNLANIQSNQFAMAQIQALQAWAIENKIDLTHPASGTLIAQFMAAWPSRMLGQQKQQEKHAAAPIAHAQLLKQQSISSPVGSESSAHGSSLGEASAQAGPSKSQQTTLVIPNSATGANNAVIGNNNNLRPQISALNKEIKIEKALNQPAAVGNGLPAMHAHEHMNNITQNLSNSNQKAPLHDPKLLQMQYLRQMQQPNRPPQPAVSSSAEGSGTQVPSHSATVHMPQQQSGFTKQQLHVLKAQILAFRRIKRGEGALPEELLNAIIPPPLDPQPQQASPVIESTGHDRSAGMDSEEHARAVSTNASSPQPAPLIKVQVPKEEHPTIEEKVPAINCVVGTTSLENEPAKLDSSAKLEQSSNGPVKSEKEPENFSQQMASRGESAIEKGKALPNNDAAADMAHEKKTLQPNSTPPKDVGATRKYHGPLFDFPCYTRKLDSFSSTTSTSNSSNLFLSYDVKDILYEEGMEFLNKRRQGNLRKINFLLSMKADRKRIRPDLILRLQIEERKLQLIDLQARLRDEVDLEQKEIMSMPDRPYRKFVRQCERQRIDLLRQVQLSQKAVREKQLKSIFQWRKKLLEAHWSIRDARTTRNRGVAKYHEKMLREFSKRKDDDRNKRMEALKNNDVDRYREMLLEQQTNIPGEASQRYAVLSSFLSQTEDYLHRLGGKITAAKNQQEVEEAARAAAHAARLQGLSEDEVKNAATCAGQEVMIRNRFTEMNAPNDHSSVNKYYNLAHAVNERVVRQPSLLRAGTLRDYQLVGLQWMLSLYNNKLNGILADEMGLGKTVQVMALIAYLMEFKGNYGPHLIIVPNAVLVNWKSELHTWLPSASCIFYVGNKEQRSKLFTQEVCAMKFNVLVTTYEFVMYDRSKLSKVDWKYIIIDEAQRMKDRDSVLARDLDRYRCQRRLLLTGTPLQNDLKELWSLLNLLLPEVFDNRKAFHDWFSKPFQRDAPPHGAEEEDDWLETEKKVIIIHRLHQILEPFMLRRRVEDVEGSLPPKVPIVMRCRMSAMQGAIYDWIKSTGTLRVDPEDELHRTQRNPLYQAKMYKNLNNKCMELRKACNHPLLNYPYFNDYSKDFLIRSCGKLWVLDRILIKLQRTGHRVLLFSTMTKLLDILEEYLQWRRLAYRRIDGTTSLEDRESAIVDFNSAGSDCFIFLLSIRAAGRGLNLQSADTVVIYDPDPNPQNEEQAVARAHRIGQKREVKVIYMEAVVDKISSYQKEDELRNGGSVDSEDDLAGKDRYMGSIESLIRNNIQQYKIDMADEVINAGRFDQRTTHEERRMTLETLLHDEERYQENVHDVPSLQEVNRMIARSDEEILLFDQMDEEFDWPGDMMKYNQVPKWLRAGSREVNAITASLSKKPSKNLLSSTVDEHNEVLAELSHDKSERRKGRQKGSADKNYSIYRELDDEDGEESDASSEERNTCPVQEEEEGEIGEDEDEELIGVTAPPVANKFQTDEEGLICDGGTYGFPQAGEGSKCDQTIEEARSSGSSSGSRKLIQFPTASTSQKFGSLSALEAKPGPSASPMVHNEELEEGEIAVSGDSQMDLQKSGSWTHEYDEGEDGVMQRKTKGKRSVRVRSRYTADRLEEKSNSERFSQSMPKLQLQVEQQTKETCDPSNKQEVTNLPLKQKRNLAPRKPSGTVSHHGLPKTTVTNCFSGSAEDGNDHSRESWNGKAVSISGTSSLPTKMSESVQRKCKNVISKLQRRIDKDGKLIIPVLFDLLRSSSTLLNGNLLDLRKIDQRVENFEYSSVSEFIADIQLMLRTLIQYCNSSYEIKSEARKVQDLFFDIMKIAFPDADLREAKTSLTFSGAGTGTPVSSPKQAVAGQSKRHKLLHDVEQNPRNMKNLSRAPPPVESQRGRESGSKPHKETRPPFPSAQSQPESSQFPHPIDMVICKKKRNDREKSAILQRIGPLSPSSSGRPGPASPFSPGRLGPVSPPSFSRAGPISPLNPSRAGPVSPPSQSRNNRGPVQKEGGSGQQQHMSVNAGSSQRPTQQSDALGVGSAGIEAQWAKPVKKNENRYR